MSFDPAKAKEFVRAVDLKGTPRGMAAQGPEETAGEVFTSAKEQALVVGSGVFSFAEGVSSQVREAISDSALLAQLVANKKANSDDDPMAWFREYTDVLAHVGWTLQEDNWADYTTEGTAAEVHEKILEVAAVVLGAAPAALAILTASVNALKGMEPDSSWIRIFSRESQRAKIARFQIGLVSKDPEGEVFVSMLACLIKAENNLTQVLFFKFRDAHASFQARNSKVSINSAALTDLGPAIRAKTRPYQIDYISNILDI